MLQECVHDRSVTLLNVAGFVLVAPISRFSSSASRGLVAAVDLSVSEISGVNGISIVVATAMWEL